MTSPVRFLFTSVGRRVELIRHFLQWQERHPGVVEILGTDMDVHAPAAQLLGSRFRGVPAATDPSYRKKISKLCREEGVDAVFPLIDPDVSVLGQYEEVPLASVKSDSIEVVSDKWITAKWLSLHHIPAARSWLPEATEENWFPAFMKPRRGSGGVNAFAVKNRREHDFFAEYIEQPVVQELLPGPEVTVDVIVGRDGSTLAIAQRRRLAIRGGEVSRAVLIEDPAINSTVESVVKALRPNGPITVQGMFGHDGIFRVTEINGRMGGGLPLAIAGGVSVAGLLTCSWAEVPVRPIAPVAVGLHMVRFDDSFFYRP